MATPPAPCKRCLKPKTACICEHVREIETRAEVLILQHPQEPDRELGSARAASLALKSARLEVGLSWRSLAHALGRQDDDPRTWAVLSLAGAKAYAETVAALPAKEREGDRLVLVGKDGAPLEQRAKLLPTIRGIVALDGTWSQAKTLWWRNAWLLKLRRAVVIPKERSLYGRMRREPRRECISTIEAIAVALTGLGEPDATREALLRLFSTQLDLLTEHGFRPQRRRRPPRGRGGRGRGGPRRRGR